MIRHLVAVVAACLIALGSARAEVATAEQALFILRGEADVVAPPAQAWRALTRIQNWWNPEHTYSGDARRLSLDARAGGCWCERWGRGQSVEHMRVVLAMENDGVRTLRLVGGLGPLQEMGVSGVMTFTVAPNPQGAKISWTYRVSGEPGLNLDRIAPIVDGVLTEQVERLRRYNDGADRP